MKTEVILCDNCKDRTAKKKCCICGIDLCNICGENVDIEMRNYFHIGMISFCKIHSNSLKKLRKENENEKEWLFDITKEVEERIKKELICANLKKQND